MASAFRRVLADGTLVAVGSAIALAWALFRVANAIGTLVVSAVSAPPFPPSEFAGAYPLTTRVATGCSSSARSWRRP